MRKSVVIEHFGGVSKTACALGISHPAVCRWRDIIPEKQALKVERLSKGALKYNPAMYQK